MRSSRREGKTSSDGDVVGRLLDVTILEVLVVDRLVDSVTSVSVDEGFVSGEHLLPGKGNIEK